MARKEAKKGKGISLAKGPVGLIGIALLAYGITGLIFGGHHFAQHAISGTQNGKTWLGLEGNGWTNLLFAGAGALLLFGAPLHWGAKTLSLVVGLALGAASLIAIVDGHDVFGIFAANGLTELVWGVAAAVLLVLALLPRVGGKKEASDDTGTEPARSRRVQRRPRDVDPEPIREREPRFERDPARAGDGARTREQAGSVVAPTSGTTRRQGDGES
jgi:hypothetical protein